MNHELDGFTVVELLAAMVVSSLVVAFVLSMYLFSERILARGQKEAEVKDAVSECAQRIIRDIESNGNVVQCDDTSLVVHKGSFGGQDSLGRIDYRFHIGRVTRNGVMVNDSQTQLSASVSFSEDTTTDQPTPAYGISERYWEVYVAGSQGSSRDSDLVHVSTIISSQELFNRSIAPEAHQPSAENRGG
ncbi:MAG: prepilin-type N-terminal cleavage/methylation domain-containing protein [Candidatus Kryptoniota bacterium]